MNRQRGVIWLTLLPYIVGAVAVAGILGGAYWKGREAGKEAMRAELVPKLESCTKRAQGLEDALATQERAVAALKAEGEARVAKATKGLAEAKKQAAGAESEAARLRKLAGEGKGGKGSSSCPAKDAVDAVRQGLK